MASKSLVKQEVDIVAAPENRQLDALRQIAEQATPPAEIRWRQGRGGARLPYTDVAYVIRTLNEAFGHDWDFDVDNEETILNPGDARPFEVKVRGRLTVRLSGQAVAKTQFGSQPIEYLKDGRAPVSIGDCYKGAASDALKKCASLLGIALDLYDSDSPIHTGGSNGGNESSRQAGRRQAAPLPKGMAGQILAFARQALKWTDAQIAGEIQARTGFALAVETLAEGMDTIPAINQRELFQALKLELEARKGANQ